MNEAEVKQRKRQPEQQQFVFAGSFQTKNTFVWFFLF